MSGRGTVGRAALRLLAEFLIIFAGVVGALLADDWRERRDDRRAEREALEQIVVDLEADSVEFGLAQEAILDQERWAAWLMVNLERPGVPADSVLMAMSGATIGRIVGLAGATYKSLRDGSNLDLIEDPGLRSEIIRYFEDLQLYLTELLGRTSEAADDVEGRLNLHRRRLPDPERLSFTPSSGYDLLTSPREIARDAELLNLLGFFGGRAAFTAARFEQVAVPENAELMTHIREALQGL